MLDLFGRIGKGQCCFLFVCYYFWFYVENVLDVGDEVCLVLRVPGGTRRDYLYVCYFCLDDFFLILCECVECVG